MASTQPAHDPALAHAQPAPSNVQQPAAAQPAQGSTQPNIPGNLIPGMANEHVMALLKHIPEMFNRVSPPFSYDRAWISTPRLRRILRRDASRAPST